MTTYNRGSGGSTLTAGLAEVLIGIANTIDVNANTLGEGALAYNLILNDIAIGADDDDQQPADPAVVAWLEGAIGVNTSSTPTGLFIRDYEAKNFCACRDR